MPSSVNKIDIFSIQCDWLTINILAFPRRMNGIVQTAEEANSYLKSNWDMLPLDLIDSMNDAKQQQQQKITAYSAALLHQIPTVAL